MKLCPTCNLANADQNPACVGCGHRWGNIPPPLIPTQAMKMPLAQPDKFKATFALGIGSVCVLILLIGVVYKAQKENEAKVEAQQKAEYSAAVAQREEQAKRDAEYTRTHWSQIQAQKQAARESAEDLKRRGKKPVPSEWDGITPEVNTYLRNEMNDYSSLQIVECSEVVPFQDDAWIQRVKFRHKNILGAYLLKNIAFVIRGGRVDTYFAL